MAAVQFLGKEGDHWPSLLTSLRVNTGLTRLCWAEVSHHLHTARTPLASLPRCPTTLIPVSRWTRQFCTNKLRPWKRAKTLSQKPELLNPQRQEATSELQLHQEPLRHEGASSHSLPERDTQMNWMDPAFPSNLPSDTGCLCEAAGRALVVLPGSWAVTLLTAPA